MTSDPSRLRDYASRIKASSPLGTTTFVIVRLLGPLLTYLVLAHGLGSMSMQFLGFKTIYYNGSGTFADLTLTQSVILLMAVGSCLKHVYWVLAVSEQEIPIGTGLLVGLIETGLDTVNSLLFMHRLEFRNGLEIPWSGSDSRYYFAIPLYSLGILLETISEIQRRDFKRTPLNCGKPYSNGLFSLARNINYGGHILWKTGYSLASGGWVWALIVGGSQLFDFVTRGVPVLDHYCQKRVSPSKNGQTRKIAG